MADAQGVNADIRASMACPKCDAKPGQVCDGSVDIMIRNHDARRKVYQRSRAR